MKICLIGGLGFIGHYLAKNLLLSNHDIVIIDNLNDYNTLDKDELRWLIPSRKNRVANSKIYLEDVNNHLSISNILKQEMPNWVIYLAAYPRAKLVDDNLHLAIKTMLSALENAALVSKEINSNFGFISSSMIYGEWPNHPIDESFLPTPVGNYGNLKYLGERLLQLIFTENLLITRLTGVYGPYDATDRVVSRMFKSALANEEILVHGKDTQLDLTYINDVVHALSNAISQNIFGVYNISSGQATTLYTLACKIKSTSNSQSEIKITDHDMRYPQRGALIYDLAREKLDYSPRVSLDEGLLEYYQWLQSH